MHTAAWNGFVSILMLLLNSGASPDNRTHDRNTPLSLAAHGDHANVVDMLIAKGCDVNNADKDLDTPLHYATFNGNYACAHSLLEHGKIFQTQKIVSYIINYDYYKGIISFENLEKKIVVMISIKI